MALTEEQLLSHLEATTIPCEELLQQFEALCIDGKKNRALEWAESLKEALMVRKNIDEAITVYQWIALQQATSPSTAQEELLQILRTHRKEQKFIPPAFEKASSLKEGFLRLSHLRSMKKGMLCYNKTWGFGIINRIDPFYQKVEIEFEKKGEHEFAFSHAADALEVLREDHLLAIRHNTPDVFIQMLKKDPAEIIRIALRSYGELPVQIIQEHFVPDLISTEAEWKKFWTAARKGLRKDPMIDIPSKRNEPIRLRKKARVYDREWFAAFQADTLVSSIFQKLEEIQAQNFKRVGEDSSPKKILEPYMIEAIANRLAFIIRGAGIRNPEWAAQAVVWAHSLGVDPANTDLFALLKTLAKRFELFDKLPAKFLGPFLVQILAATDEAAKIMIGHIPEMGTSAIASSIDALIDAGHSTQVAECFLLACRARVCSPSMLVWLHRHLKQAQEWELIDPVDLTFQTLEAIEKDFMGEALRAQNTLRDRLEKLDFLHPALDAMSHSQRRDFMRRISESPAWSKLDRQSLQAKIIKHRPELHEIVLRKATAPKEKKISITSKRSYQNRKDQFEHILKKEIPENSKELELARSYGDLRENAEFKYAKERQRLLSLQAAELQTALDTVKPTDFSGFPSDVAGIATGVELSYASGTRETYYILGEWDQDEEMHIISCEAGMAKTLNGAKTGDIINVPTSSGNTTKATVIAVTPLPETIQKWIEG